MLRPIGFLRDETAKQPHKQHSMVRLVKDFRGPDGVIPMGSIGMILQIFDQGDAYQVEFEEHDIPETVSARLLEPISGAT